MIEYVLMGKHLTPPPTEWMVSRGSKKLIKTAKKYREDDPNYSQVEYRIMKFEKYLEDLN